jgi:cytoskeletal protein CcmA (bactofilin family)
MAPMDTADPVAAPDSTPATEPPQRRFTDRESCLASIVGPGIAIEGSFGGNSDVEIWGGFTGELNVDGLLRLRPGSRVVGTIDAVDLVVEGELEGEVRARGKVDLRATCRVEAEIVAARVVAAEGSDVEGRITVTGEKGNVTTYSERRSS